MERKAKIIPSIRYKNCEKAIEWLCGAFGFEKNLTVPGDSGTILHAQLVCGDSMIMLGSAHERDEIGRLNSSPLELEGQNTATIYMIVDCTSSANLGPMGLIFKRHFSASCFSSLTC